MVSPSRWRTIRVGAAPGDHPDGLLGDRRRRGRPSRTRPSALLTTLLVTDDDVAVGRSARRRARRARGRPGRRRRAPRATPSGAQTSIAGHARRRRAPRPRRPSRRSRRGRSSSAARRGTRCPACLEPRRPGRRRGCRPASRRAPRRPTGRRSGSADAAGGDLDADAVEQLRGHAAHVGAADDGGEADDRRGRGASGVADARARRGWCRPRPPGWTAAGAPGRPRRSRRAPRAPGSAASSPTTSTASAGTAACSRTQYSWKCTTRLAARAVGVGDRDVRLDAVVGHRQQPDRAAAASAGTAPRSPADSG